MFEKNIGRIKNRLKILVINGPNINMLGIREKSIYGEESFEDLLSLLKKLELEYNIEIDQFQSNFEGEIIEKIQSAYKKYDGLVINPAGFTHTSIAILDALKAVEIPTVEVHISDLSKREDFRKKSFISKYAIKTITGHGIDGYREAILFLKDNKIKRKLKGLIVDNYDSYTYNLYQLVAEVSGNKPLVVKNDEISYEEVKELDPDYIIISPGPGSPENERFWGL